MVPGLSVATFEGDFQDTAALARAQPARTGTAATFAIPADAPNERFGLRFTGYIDIPREGLYTFYTASDDGSVLFVGDTLVVDNDGLHSHSENLGEINLARGRHAITVLYFQGPGGKSLEVGYEGPGMERRAIPAEGLWRGE
ncbi:MAG: PA14 domain protein [Betaproteobacteria bacterium ADurb.Bin341]|nr:MAG: PA14 domain protein [Betaproteobacteria bacterium ADurb.Bin341]